MKKMNKRFWAIFMAVVLVLSMWTPVAASSTSISKSSITIEVGDTYQLNALSNGKIVTATWGSSNKSVASVSTTGLVTGHAAGSAVITAMVGGTSMECLVSVVKKSTSATTRYNVLILDASNSVKGTPLKYEKEAAKRFCKAVLNTSGNNYLAVVTLNKSPQVICGFTDNLATLNKKIDSIKVSAYTNINDAFKKADSLLSNVPNGTKVMKNIILCSDGIPNKGAKASSGRYSSGQHKYYKYANGVYNTDVALKKKGYFVYALGFFHNSTGKDLSFGKKLMKDLASKDKYYSVTKAKDIDKIFNKIANKITQATISKTSLTLYVGDTYTLTTKVDGVTKSASWKSSSTSVAAVSSSGKVTAKKAGTATITATIDGQTLTCKVTVKKPTLKINKTSATIYVGKTLTLKATENGKSRSVTWKSSNSKIATVSSKGVVTGKKAGEVTITGTYKGATVKCVVTVKPTVTLNKSKITLYVGEKYILKATVKGTSKKVTWKSSKSSIATVSSSGVVTAKKVGTTVISASVGGTTTKCTVTVKKATHPLYSYYFTCPKTTYRGKSIDEHGLRLVLNDSAVIEKCGVYLKKSGSYWYCTMAFKGQNVTSAKMSAYISYKGKILYDGISDYYLNSWTMRKDSSGIWTRNGSWDSAVKFNTTDSSGKNIANAAKGKLSENIKIFTDLDEMKKWLNS